MLPHHVYTYICAYLHFNINIINHHHTLIVKVFMVPFKLCCRVFWFFLNRSVFVLSNLIIVLPTKLTASGSSCIHLLHIHTYIQISLELLLVHSCGCCLLRVRRLSSAAGTVHFGGRLQWVSLILCCFFPSLICAITVFVSKAFMLQ